MDEEKKKMLRECGACQMSLKETCMILEISEDEFLRDPENFKNYHIGELLTKFEIRKSVINLAKNGVPAMIKIYTGFFSGEPEREKITSTEAKLIEPDIIDIDLE